MFQFLSSDYTSGIKPRTFQPDQQSLLCQDSRATFSKMKNISPPTKGFFFFFLNKGMYERHTAIILKLLKGEVNNIQ